MRQFLRVGMVLLFFSTLVGANRGGAEFEKERRALGTAVDKGDFVTALATIDRLIESGHPEALDAVLAVSFGEDTGLLEKRIAERLAVFPDSDLLLHASELAKTHESDRVRVLLTLALAERKEKHAYTAVLQNLFDRRRPVVLAAIEALERRNSRSCIPGCIKALEYREKQGPAFRFLRHELRRFMMRLTDQDLELAADWRNWWQARGQKDYVERELAGHTALPDAWGIELTGRRVLFVLDISDSMKTRDPLPDPKPEPGSRRKGGGGTAVGDGKGKKGDEGARSDARMRLRRVQKEMSRIIDDLEEDVRFNIVSFNSKIRWWQPGGLRPATAANKRSATNFARAFEPDGETYTDRALEAAFSIHDLEAIYLLSDGEPLRDDEPIPSGDILEWLQEENRFRHVRVHTIGFKHAGARSRWFLKRLAQQTRGEFVALD